MLAALMPGISPSSVAQRTWVPVSRALGRVHYLPETPRMMVLIVTVPYGTWG